ncbi:UDP-3-O-(3-hydroxymyristoyl)glucosamine N-acyltransferase [Candidatus Pelagibacter bacterium]|nr:UDP-3-O-(3-hydroxymyristoyl)glucosamine N-acyltransferase [Candidatus Pelagibacter bacterium]
MINPFFKNYGPFKIKDLFNDIDTDNPNILGDDTILDIRDLVTSNNNHLTFFHSKKYQREATVTKASYCVTSKNLIEYLPKSCKAIYVDNVLLTISKVTSKFYPESINDNFDNTVKKINEIKLENNVLHGHNVLVGENVKIGNNSSIGHNTIVEKNVIIGSNCSIGSNVIIRNTIVEDNVTILDGCVIGKKGFGFFPNNQKNLRYPHIGIVYIGKNSEIGSGTTIDRGSMSNTVIGQNTFLDNQIHVAHNNKIGNNCIIAGQVGFAGSSTLGNNVMIGGQAGISGHLKIGSNVQIGGGSGVIKDIPDNSKVMGYPSKNLRQFLEENK